MNKIIFIIVVIIIVSCGKQTNQTFLLNSNGKSNVRFIIKNCDTTKHYTLLINNILPRSQINRDINVDKDTIFNYQLDLHYPVYGNLYAQNESAEFFLIPNDTLRIILDFNNGVFLKDIVSFEGETSPISDFLTQYRKHWYSAPSKNESIKDYNLKIDEFYNKQLILIDSIALTKTIAKKYIDIETANIHLEKAYCKSRQRRQRYAFYKQFISERKQLDLNHMQYFWLQNATDLLGIVAHEKYDTILYPPNATKEIFFQYCQDNIDSLKNKLNSHALSFYIVYRASVLFNEKRLFKMNSSEFKDWTNQTDLFIENNTPLIKDSTLYEFMINKRDSIYGAYASRNTLKNGDAAPNFFLQSPGGKTINLKEYYGKLVLLNFWGTYCAPCIHAIPKENALIKQFDNEQFILVNICTNYDTKSWKKIINEEEFKGEHLICNGEWNNILCTKYNIFGVPHYVLINKNGEIIKNNIRSDSIATYIKDNI